MGTLKARATTLQNLSSSEKSRESAHEPREKNLSKLDIKPNRGRLRNGNPSGDFMTAPRCGARNRQGLPCRAPAMRGKRRCRLHGGKSTGPRTKAGIQAIRKAHWKGGLRSPRLQAECRAAMAKEAAMYGAMGIRYSVQGICRGGPPKEWADE